jgi:hypothetical protein
VIEPIEVSAEPEVIEPIEVSAEPEVIEPIKKEIPNKS